MASARGSISARDIDVVLMRQDPPFDLGYITATHLLERIEGETLVVNDPASVRNAPEKVFVLDYRALHAAHAGHAQRRGSARASMAKHGAVVVKPIHGNGGKAIFRVPESGDNLSPCSRCSTRPGPSRTWSSPSFPRWPKGDKRIVLVDGEVAGAINRRPGEGEFRSNLARRRLGREDRADRARGGNLRRARPGAEGARPDLRRAST